MSWFVEFVYRYVLYVAVMLMVGAHVEGVSGPYLFELYNESLRVIGQRGVEGSKD
jgi:hypothetical protein